MLITTKITQEHKYTHLDYTYTNLLVSEGNKRIAIDNGFQYPINNDPNLLFSYSFTEVDEDNRTIRSQSSNRGSLSALEYPFHWTECKYDKDGLKYSISENCIYKEWINQFDDVEFKRIWKTSTDPRPTYVSEWLTSIVDHLEGKYQHFVAEVIKEHFNQ